MIRLFLCLILIVAFSVPYKIFGQDSQQKFGIFLGGGLSLPIESYGKQDASNAAIYANSTQVKGFAKEKCGFAKTGFNYNLEIKYKLSSSLKLLLITGTYSNSVETQGMSDYITHISPQIVEEESYRYLYILPGIGYYYSLNKFNLSLNLFLGYSITRFPYYKFIFIPFYGNPPMMFAHNGPRPNLEAFTLGTSLSTTYNISKRFSIGIDLIYQRANFNYTVSPELIPGGGGANLTFSDILKLRVINTGLKIGYSF